MTSIKGIEFDPLLKDAGNNTFTMSPTRWEKWYKHYFHTNQYLNYSVIMRHITAYTTDNEYNHFVQLAKTLYYVKRIETDEEPTKEDILDNIKAGLKEVHLFKKGKLKTSNAQSFLDEL